MSQQSLASKTMTKRNVAQSSVIFSVVVAVITLGVIATVAYIDITQDNDLASLEKSIPELISEQTNRLTENHKQIELLSQAEDLVSTSDQRVEDLKQLDSQVKKINEQLNFIQANIQPSSSIVAPVKPIATAKVFKTVQHVMQPSIKSMFDQNYAANIKSSQQLIADGEAYLDFSWLFKARAKMTMDQRSQLQNYLKSQSGWNAKTL